ncbi:RTA1 like protein-domain-containing protein [Bombardia bombarda]|uniref:RTA1 like protein-domain-containing protein n=1 Tax=Bombardia bombarda TaxID=252184 RepID=A0AA39XKP6_9PEZI|nr:RTA1 like protein-domain-containing protein [Bombardia bombarda]
MSSGDPPAPEGIDDETWHLLLHIKEGCFPYLDDRLDNSYGYWPSLPAGIIFSALFGIVIVGHLFQFVRFRKWTSILIAIGAITEALGWAARTWSAKCPYNGDAFLMQITTLIIAPTFFAAAMYVLLGTLITLLGRDTSMMSPKLYTIIFCTCDVISLVVQAVGGALAADAADKIDGDTKQGTNIMVAGIVFQLFTMTVFAVLVMDFLRRVYKRERHDKRGNQGASALSRPMKLVLAALFVAFVVIYIRSVYRTIELVQGWDGYLITHEAYFVALDGSLMVVASGVFLVLDPATLLRNLKPGSDNEYPMLSGEDSEGGSPESARLKRGSTPSNY